MILVTVSFDTQATSPDEICSLIKDGQLLHVAGILNTCWNDYSALHVAKQSGLHTVEWDYTGDDTPATIELAILYSHLDKTQVSGRLQEICGVETVEVNGELLYDIYSGVPFNDE